MWNATRDDPGRIDAAQHAAVAAGWSLAQLGRRDEALSWYERVADDHPGGIWWARAQYAIAAGLRRYVRRQDTRADSLAARESLSRDLERLDAATSVLLAHADTDTLARTTLILAGARWLETFPRLADLADGLRPPPANRSIRRSSRTARCRARRAAAGSCSVPRRM